MYKINYWFYPTYENLCGFMGFDLVGTSSHEIIYTDIFIKFEKQINENKSSYYTITETYK